MLFFYVSVHRTSIIIDLKKSYINVAVNLWKLPYNFIEKLYFIAEFQQ